MNKNDRDLNETERTKRLAEDLCKHPLLRERMETILALVRSEDGPIRKADEIEALLVNEVRKLGNEAMQNWAESAEERVACELLRDSPWAYCIKKKS